MGGMDPDIGEEYDPDRGQVLFEETPEAIRRRRTSVRLIGVITIAAGVLMAAFLFPLPDFMPPAIKLAFFLTPIVLFTYLGARIIIGASRSVTFRIYERGLSTPDILVKDPFIPWRKVTELTVEKGRDGKDRVSLEIEDRPTVLLPAGLVREDDLRALLDRWGERGDGEEETGPGDLDMARWHRFNIFMLFFLALVLSSFVTSLTSVGIMRGSTNQAFSITFPWAVLVVLVLLLWLSSDKERDFIRAERVQRWFLLMVAIALVGFLAALAIAGEGAWWQDLSVESTLDPGEGVLPPGEYEDMQMDIEGWVTVHDGEVLRLTNVTLDISAGTGGEGGIWVGPGGRLELRASSVSASTSRRFSFEVHGSALVEDCIISGTFRNGTGDRVDGGLEIGSDDVHISRTVFRGEGGRGVSVFSASPRLLNCSFEGLYVGVYAGKSEIDIEGCSFIDCNHSIWVAQDGSRIIDCVFENVTWGVQTSWVSSTTIVGCTFIGCREAAILHTDYTDTEMRDNVFVNNTENVSFIRHVAILGLKGPNLVRNMCIGTGLVCACITATFVLFVKFQTRRDEGDLPT